MRVVFTEPFKKDYEELPSKIQRVLNKALKFLIKNPRHPSLRIKKFPSTSIWYGRLSRAYRFTFQQSGEVVILRRVGTHRILDKERK